MSYTVYNLKQFYASRAGRLVRRLLASHIHDIWPDVTGQSLMGYGYAVPYLKRYQEEAERVCAVMPVQGGVHQWPAAEGNQVCLSSDTELPFATESLDRILVVHGLEFSEAPGTLLHEFWRVLKSNGRLLIVAPNRLGLWARIDRTPFGHGTPYTSGQIHHYLQQNLFVTERKSRALFMPPFRSFLVLRSAYVFEGFGKYIFPGLAGVHLLEASKQIYAGAVKARRESLKGRRIMLGNPVPTRTALERRLS